jgi:hypothetical protein
MIAVSWGAADPRDSRGRLRGSGAFPAYNSEMTGGFSGIILAGAFGAVTALCAVLIPKLYRVSGGDTPAPSGEN